VRPEDWERLLLAVTDRVRRRVAPLAGRGDREKSIGIGAAGDRTLYADKVAEDEILKALAKAGGVRVLSEEAGLVGDPTAKTLAVVDPLDGSSNFSRGVPFYCTSVAIVGGRSEVGVVRELVSGDVYSAIKGRGSKKNGKAIRTSRAADVSEAVVGIDLSRGGRDVAERLAPLVGAAKRQLHFGANALELCYVAEGKTDAFVDLRGRMRVTDLAAARIIASEAGAVITGADGAELVPEFDLSHRLSFVASASRGLHKQILELVAGPPGGRAEPR
jgi:myo-inositol-1(or 4)-monophosphatase